MSLRQFGVLAICLSLIAGGQARLVGDDQSKPPADAESAVTTLPEIPRHLHDLLQSREYDAAVTAIDALLTEEPQATETSYLLYLKGRALTEQQRYDEAVTVYGQIEEDHPKSDWVSRARFGRTDIYVRSHNYLAAGQIYQQEAERLLSRGRKDELAAIYLEFADRYFEGIPADDPSKARQPDYEQALTYYREAVKLEPTVPVRQRIQFRIARCLEELSNWGEAIAAYQSFLKDFAGDEVAEDAQAPSVMIAEAQYRLGSVQLNNAQPAAARKTWTDFLANIDEFKGDQPAQDDDGAITNFHAQAAYRLAHTFGLPHPDTVGDLELAVAAAEGFLKDYPDHELAPQAELEIAQGLLHHGRFEQAVERLNALIANKDYKNSKQVPLARQLLGQSYLSQRKFDEAIQTFKAFLENHPTDTHWADVQRQIVTAEFAKANFARQDKRYDDARKLWETFLNKYPLDARAPSVLYYFGQMKYAAATGQYQERVKQAIDAGQSPQSVEAHDAERQLYEVAIADWRKLVSKYPQTNEASRAALMIGITLEEQLGRLKEALAAYKSVTGQYASKAAERITRLIEPLLEIVTERKFRSDEQPRIKLSTRNLEHVSVKVYRVDMTDYFRKMHLATGIESLDIALIDPDSQFDYAVADYEAYRLTEADIDVPMDGPGVMAVTVASDKLEATTMVVVSDLDVVVKSSRNELFVFAQNMRTGQPMKGANLLISDGNAVFAEVQTGKDGISQQSFDELKDSSDLRVFAIHEGHMASTVTNLDGLDFAVGLTPRGYLYTDRPAYRAGQLVNIKGIVRWVDGDRFTFKQGEKFTIDLYDARSRLLHSETLALNAYGTIADNFVLPVSSPQGTYRLHLHQPNGKQSYETTFTVSEYRLEPVRLSVELDKNVYYRGEQVTGTISLAYYYGSPLADEPITYTLGDDGEQITARTDDEGHVTIKLDTRRFNESQPVTLNVQYPARNLTAAHTVYLSTRGFDVNVKTLRDVYVSGETFDATVTLTDPAGQPVETDVTVEVFERTSAARHSSLARGERLVTTHNLTTDGEGTAHHTLTLDDPGRYFVRATGTDQFGNKISGERAVQISGEKDAVRLRILADRHRYKVGDEAAIRLHWREDAALALVTYEGARILGYQIVALQRGENKLNLPMTADLAPNFNLSVAVMERNRFHAAEAGFVVSQRLNIALKPANTEAQPGEAVEVVITTTDPQGKPVAAEVSLGLVQSNLLNRYADVQGAIDEFFGSGQRQPSVRQTASCTFQYAPTTSGIHEALLAEQHRRKQLERELRALGELEAVELAQRRLGHEVGETLDESLALGVEFDYALGMRASEVDGLTIGHLADNDSGYSSSLGGMGGRGARWGNQAGRIVTPDGASNADLRAAYGRSTADFLEQGRTGAGFSTLYSRFYPVGDFVLSPDGTIGNQPFDGTTNINGNGAIDLFDVTQQSRINLNAVNNAGVFLALNGRSELELKQLVADGLTLLPGMANAETGFWDPAILTDAKGTATVTITLPQQSTAWSLRAKGINNAALTGQTAVDLITRKELFGDLKLPLAFTSGDTAQIPVEIHNSLDGPRQLTVLLKTTIGEKATELSRTINVEGPGIETLSLPVTIDDADSATFELTVRSMGFQPVRANEKKSEPRDDEATPADGLKTHPTKKGDEDLSDTITRTIPIRPYGAPVYATAGGTASQSTLAFVEFPKDIAGQQPKLEIVIGPSIHRTLLDAVLGGGDVWIHAFCLPDTELERAVSDILGGVALLKMIDASKDSDIPEARALAGRITTAISLLVSSQREDGSWNWRKDLNAGEGDRYLSSRAMWALSLARQAGFGVPAEQYQAGQSYLQSAFASTARSDLESQAILLHGMAASQSADFALVNRLYRERNALSGSGVLHLALAMTELDRKETAGELLRLFTTQHAGSLDQPDEPKMPWMNDASERRALYLLVMEAIDPTNANIAKVTEQLLADRIGSRWPIEKANGPAVLALARWFSRIQHASEKYELTVFVNDKEVGKLTIDPSKDGTRRLTVPTEMLIDNERQRVNFELSGRGEFSYSVVMTGFVPAAKLAKTTDDFLIKREYHPAPRMFDGKSIPRGFGIVDGSYTSFSNPFTQVPVGDRGEVHLYVQRRGTTDDPARHYDHLVITDPIPAGCIIREDSIEGANLLRYEIEPGQITFYLGDTRYPGSIYYSLVGYVPGVYKATPAIVRSLYDPAKMAIAPAATVTVLPAGEPSSDPYRLTPEELNHLGFAHYGKGNLKEAHNLLTQLVDNWRLQASPYKEASRALFATSLDADDHASTVKYFEVIKEKFPDIEVSFEDILQVALSYRELGEYERSYLVYRMTLQGSFERESQVAGFLEQRGEFLRSVKVLEELLRDYPAEAYLATATYALAQEVYRMAPNARDDHRLQSAGFTRVHLIAAAIRMLDHFLTTWPEDPAADQASFALANALLDLEQYETAITRSEAYAQRYPDSRLLDSYWYIIGYSHFALKQPEQALEMCRKVAEAMFNNPDTGGQRPADNKWEAVYIMGQVYHSLGKAAAAIAEYAKVDERFPDAAQAIDFFTRKNIALDEVTTLRPDDEKQLPLRFRNIAAASIKVYRIDLMKFGLMQRNLDRITAINLAGIKPYYEGNVELGDGKDYRDRTHQLTLPLKDEGAYLVVCRGENLYASGLALVTPLSLEVQEDATSGRVRVTVKDATDDAFLDDVQVKVIGSANEDFQSGETDLRGLFIADDVQGTSTIIARADAGEYAFYRGELALQGALPNAAATTVEEAEPVTRAKEESQEQLLRGKLFEQNSLFQEEQRSNYKDLLLNERSGIKTKEAY